MGQTFRAEHPQKLTKNDEDVSEAVGAPGQHDPSFGPISMAKFRNIAQKGYHLALCDGMKPWALQSFPSTIAYASKTDSSNAAKLYIHYMLTEEGFAIQLADGKPAANSQISAPDDPSHVKDLLDQMAQFAQLTAEDDRDGPPCPHQNTRQRRPRTSSLSPQSNGGVTDDCVSTLATTHRNRATPAAPGSGSPFARSPT